ncbi:MAG: TetR family transcriptional regulator [Dysgonomonas sp.]|nr:TetR family transcriptional regulator [Dysgonomonas sp.]
MENIEHNPPRRTRRKREDIEKSILAATEEVVKEVGFNNATISAIIQKAKIETPVFYKRYKDLYDLLDKFVRPYDYWLKDNINFDPDNLSLMDNNINLLLDLVDSINSDKSKIMQQVLIWELTNDNEITRRTADNRERNSKNLIDFFSENFKDPDIDIRAISALFISGIYYLAMHKQISTFCFIDFDTKEGIDILKRSIKGVIKKMYMHNENVIEEAEKKKAIEIAKKMHGSGVDIEHIIEYTGLSEDQLESAFTTKKRRGRPAKKK